MSSPVVFFYLEWGAGNVAVGLFLSYYGILSVWISILLPGLVYTFFQVHESKYRILHCLLSCIVNKKTESTDSHFALKTETAPLS
jgi:hypothetical protein